MQIFREEKKIPESFAQGANCSHFRLLYTASANKDFTSGAGGVVVVVRGIIYSTTIVAGPPE